MNLYKVIPIINLPFNSITFFTYSSSENLNKGDLIKIEFRKKNIFGIVYEKTKKTNQTNFKIKPITLIVKKKFYNKEYLDFIFKVADYYYTTPNLILKTVFIKKPKKIHQYSSNIDGTKKISIQKNELKTVKKIIKKLNKNDSILLKEKDPKNIFNYLTAKYLNKNKQILFLLPSMILCLVYKKHFQKIFGDDKLSILGRHQSLKSIYENQEKIRNNDAQIILGTRFSIFNYFKNLELIIIDESHNNSFKDWSKKPFFDARKAAEILSKTKKTKIILTSNCPNIKNYYLFQNKLIKEQ